MASLTREFWIYIPTGRVWAVELRDGVLVGAAGPLRPEDADPELLDHLLYSSTDLPWIIANRSAFRRKDGADRPHRRAS